MKKIYLACIVLLTSFLSYAQTMETEPNNDFSTANSFLELDDLQGTLNAVDTLDFHGLDFNRSGDIVFTYTATNTGTAGLKTFFIEVYNSLTSNGEYVSIDHSESVQLNEGSSFSWSFKLCGMSPDSFYVKLRADGDISYNIQWHVENEYDRDDLGYFYNNSPALATPFLINIPTEGTVGYQFWGGTGFNDTLDYFKSTLPVGNYNDINLRITAENSDCNVAAGMRYACYKNSNAVPFAEGFVGGSNNVQPKTFVYTTVPLNNMQAGDTLLVKYSATTPFGYRFRYGIPDEFEPDAENNCCITNAIPIVENQVVTGNVGEYDYNNNEYIDEYDTYRMILPQHGAVKLFVKGRNEECSGSFYNLSVQILDTDGEIVSDASLIDWDSPTCGTIELDTTKLRAFSNDTFYVRFYTSSDYGKVSYNFKYQLADSATSETSENYNGSVGYNLTLLPVGQTKKGTIRFKKTSTQTDLFDFFRVDMPATGSVKIFIKSTFRGDQAINNFNDNNNLNFSGLGVGFKFPQSTIFNIIPDAVYIDSFTVCGVDSGSSIFSLGSNLPYEYELSYVILDTSAVFNDPEPNNTVALAVNTSSTTLYKGRIAYSGTADIGGDHNDYYKMIIGSSDTLKIFMQAINKSCVDNKTVYFSLYKNQTQTIWAERTFNNVLANQMVSDSIKVFATEADTFYLRINATAPFAYEFYRKQLKPTSNFYLLGDSSVCLGLTTYTARNTKLTSDAVTYNWSLPQGGGTLTFVDSLATVIWNTTGNRQVRLFLSNSSGNSASKLKDVVVNNNPPTQIPNIANFARTLSVADVPPGASCQWFRNGTIISGATLAYYYAALSGSYTVKFLNPCGLGEASNPYSFPADALVQVITFPHVATLPMSLNARAKLNATSTSGLPVTYTLVSGLGLIQNDSVIIYRVGTFIVKATQAGDDVYSAAINKFDTFTVIKGNQIITFEAIANQVYAPAFITTSSSNSSGLLVYISSTSTNIDILYNSFIYMTGAGTATVTAYHPGNDNYNAATSVQQTFCIGVRNISAIVGANNPCLGTYKYTTQKITGAAYTWTLSGGGILTTNNDTATVQWQTLGNHTLKVKVNSACDPVFSNEQVFIITTSNSVPGAVSGMLPANNAIDRQLPLQLSWIPGGNTVNYDLYVWPAAQAQPVTPYAANLTGITFTLPLNSFAFNATYKWRVVSKNPCSQATSGAIQQFSLIPLPDFAVSNVQAPATANSGQAVTISWTVTNLGPGNTGTNQQWNDAVFLSFDTIPNFILPPNVGTNWVLTDFPVRTKLIAIVPNLTALNNGQGYTKSITYTLPINVSTNIYAYVITNYNPNSNAPIEVTRVNDTAHNPQPIVVTLSPTPDLRVENVFTPATTFSGSTINVTYRVKNYGVLTPAGATWTDRVFLSQSPLFDSASSIMLNAPRWNNSYYPDALKAFAVNTTQLLSDSSYTKTVQAVIPNYILGTWFVWVKTNSGNALYEGALINNNVNSNQVQIYLTPTPKLTITNLNVPLTTASTTQPIGVNWNIYNDGIRDNIERNKGHYFDRYIGTCPCYTSTPNATCLGDPQYIDSTGAGSSFWIDRTYLSTDSSGLNIGNAVLVSTYNHGTEYSGYLVYDPFSAYVGFPTSCYFIGPQNISNVINPGSNFPTNVGIRIPENLQPGNYYVYVYTNPTKTVYEYPGTAQIKRSALPINIQRPDLVAPTIAIPATVTGGQSFAVNYSIINNGPGGVFSSLRNDRIYVSNFPNFDASATLVGTQTFTENLPVGVAVPHVFQYSFAPSTSGAKYFYVHTNFDSSFKETNNFNNISASAATTVLPASPADLIVSNIIIADTVFSIQYHEVIYTVTNNGPAATNRSWVDSLYVSCFNTFSSVNNNYLHKKTQNRILAAGASYTDTMFFNTQFYTNSIAVCFPQVANTPAYFYVKTNASGTQYEGTNTNNNILSSGSKVFKNPYPDHIVTSVNLFVDTVTVGTYFTVRDTIKNIGYNPGSNYYSTWRDQVYFSTDSLYNVNDFKANYFLNNTPISRNQSKSFSTSTLVPNIATGDYYVLMYTNADGFIANENPTNNVNFVRNALGAAKKIHVIQPLLPDLTDSILSAPISVNVGQPLPFLHRINNIGPGFTYTSPFENKLWLSNNFFAADTLGDRLLIARTEKRVIQPGANILDSVAPLISLNTIPGNYVLKSKVNTTGNIFETNSSNNYAFKLITITSPPPSDLIVQNITSPDTVFLGYTIDTLRYQVINQSANAVTGITTDGFYLSQNTVLDSTAMLIGLKNKTINMAALKIDTLKAAPLVNNVTEGNYNIFIKTDLLNNIVESDKTNNTGASITPIYVGVKELPMNVLTPNTLPTQGRYYKLLIPDSLRGSTIKITLKTNDSSLVRNEMYVGANYIPSNARFTYKFEIPNYGNQQIVMTDVYDSLYYIFYRCVSPNPPLQNVTLKAEKLPFSILNVNSASGGNIGNVTVKISGSLFKDSMMAKLSNAGTTIFASAVYFTNSTTVYATFNLAGKPLGLYTVTLTKTDGSTAVMPNGFSIVPANNGGLITGSGVNSVPGNGNAPGCDPGAPSGLNSQLIMELVLPPLVVVNIPYTMQLNYSNPTNSDISAQSRVLYSELKEKMALSAAAVATGSTSLYLELTEPGGPPGIIRAGGSGTIIIYTKAPTVLTNGSNKQTTYFTIK